MARQKKFFLSSLLALVICGDHNIDSVQAFVAVTPKAATVLSPQQASLSTRLFRSSPNNDNEDGQQQQQVASTMEDKEEGSTENPTEAAMQQQQQQKQQQQKLRLQQQQQQSLSQRDLMTAMGTSPRRIVVSLLSASGIALAGNFLGVTSRLLTAVPEETVEASGLDTYFPRGDFKRCRGKEYTFVIPKEWVADTFVELAKAQRQVKSLDYSMDKRRGGGGTTLPDSAYGPAGRLNKDGVSESGDTNVSVIVSTGLNNFSLQGTLGTPTSAAEKLLRLSIAPEGSGRVATLESAVEDVTRGVYQFEFVVERVAKRLPPLRNISVIAASPTGDKLYTLTVVAPVKAYEDNPVYANKLRKIAESFHLTI